MVRRGHEPPLRPRNGAGESFVSFIALFGGLVALPQGHICSTLVTIYPLHRLRTSPTTARVHTTAPMNK
jgi:hypothetical protein